MHAVFSSDLEYVIPLGGSGHLVECFLVWQAGSGAWHLLSVVLICLLSVLNGFLRS